MLYTFDVEKNTNNNQIKDKKRINKILVFLFIVSNCLSVSILILNLCFGDFMFLNMINIIGLWLTRWIYTSKRD